MTTQAYAPDSTRHRLAEGQLRPVTSTTGQGGAVLPAQVGVRVLGSDPLSREGVIRFLQECPDVRVVAESSSAAVVVVVIDQVSDGTVRMLRSIREDTAPRIVLVVGDLDTGRTADVMQAGAVGIIRRSEVTRSGLRRLIRSVAAGEAVVPPDVLTALLGRSAPQPSGSRLAVLSLNDREQKVLRLLADGSDTREIAHLLSFSERTAKTVIQEITHRFGLRNRSHAVAYALRQGLI